MNIIITGLITGSMLVLLAIGFSLIFGVARIVNIAHTAFYMVAGYCIYLLSVKLGLHPVPGMLIAVVVVTVFLGAIDTFLSVMILGEETLTPGREKRIIDGIIQVFLHGAATG